MNAQTRDSHSVPFFLPASKGNLFCCYFPASGPSAARSGILFFPPFAEEMNKSRRIVAQQARRFAGMGHAVLVPDLYGTGDSEGRFDEADWETWVEDIGHAIRWLQGKGIVSLNFWGLRLGALLALDCARHHADLLAGLLLWQPVLKGKNFLTQFLRLRLAADLMGKDEKITTQEMRQQLEAGPVLK